MKRILKTFSLMFAALVLFAACTQMGLTPAQSLDEKIAYGYGAVTSVRTSAAQAVTVGAISKADGSAVLAATDSARAVLDGASAASRYGDAPTAMTKLATATAIIAQLQQYLTARGVK